MADIKHGTRTGYNNGCRCRPCTIANRIYTRNYKRFKEGYEFSLIDPEQLELEQRILAEAQNEGTEEDEHAAS